MFEWMFSPEELEELKKSESKTYTPTETKPILTEKDIEEMEKTIKELEKIGEEAITGLIKAIMSMKEAYEKQKAQKALKKAGIEIVKPKEIKAKRTLFSELGIESM